MWTGTLRSLDARYEGWYAKTAYRTYALNPDPSTRKSSEPYKL